MHNSKGLLVGHLAYKVHWTQSAQQKKQSKNTHFQTPFHNNDVRQHIKLYMLSSLFIFYYIFPTRRRLRPRSCDCIASLHFLF